MSQRTPLGTRPQVVARRVYFPFPISLSMVITCMTSQDRLQGNVIGSKESELWWIVARSSLVRWHQTYSFLRSVAVYKLVVSRVNQGVVIESYGMIRLGSVCCGQRIRRYHYLLIVCFCFVGVGFDFVAEGTWIQNGSFVTHFFGMKTKSWSIHRNVLFEI